MKPLSVILDTGLKYCLKAVENIFLILFKLGEMLNAEDADAGEIDVALLLRS